MASEREIERPKESAAAYTQDRAGRALTTAASPTKSVTLRPEPMTKRHAPWSTWRATCDRVVADRMYAGRMAAVRIPRSPSAARASSSARPFVRE